MSQIDTTFHISDLLVMGGALCTAIGFAARRITRAVQHKIADIDRRIKDHGEKLVDHGRRIGDMETSVGQHEAALKKLGFHRENGSYVWRSAPDADPL
jgi:hypothetical protein